MCDARLESAAETRTDVLCWTQRLPRPTPQVIVKDEDGHEFARVDFAWLAHGVFLEFDGRIKYEKYRRKGETLEAVPHPREEARGADLSADRLGVHPHRLGRAGRARGHRAAGSAVLLDSRRPASA